MNAIRGMNAVRGMNARRGLGILAVALAGGCATVSVNERIRAERMEQAVAPMAKAALEAGQIETARRLYARLLEIDPDSATARSGLGEVALVLGQVGEAAQWYGEAAEHALEPAARRAALLAHGRTALAAGDLKGARTSFAELGANPTAGSYAEAAWGFNGIGVVDLLEGDPFAAATAFESALRLAPGEPRFQSNLARARELAVALPDAPPTIGGATAVGDDTEVPEPMPVVEEEDREPVPAAAPRMEAEELPAVYMVAVAEAVPLPEVAAAEQPAPATVPAADLAETDAADTPAARPAETGTETPVAVAEPNEIPAPAAIEPSGWLVRNGTGEYLQVGAFAAEDGAQRALDRVSGLTELPVLIETAENGGRSVHRVRIGPIASRTMLPDLAGALGIDAGAIRLPWPSSGGG